MRLFFSPQRTWQLNDAIVLRRDIPKLDILDGAAINILGGFDIDLQ